MTTTRIPVSHQEVTAGRLAPERLKLAVEAIRTEGYVILEDVVDCAHLDVLRTVMLRDVERIRARADAPFNFNSGNIQQQPPLQGQYLFRDVLVNDMVIAVTSAVLGPGMKTNFYSGNTCLPGDRRQPVHFDSGEPEGDGDGPAPPSALVVNVPVVDVNARNGSTEIWPGTHRLAYQFRGQGDDIKIPSEALEAQRKITPPIQPSLRLGSVLIRDMRLWHAGMPNFTDTPRPMIAMTHRLGPDSLPVLAPVGTEAMFQHPLLLWIVQFTDEPVDHIGHGDPYDFAPRG